MSCCARQIRASNEILSCGHLTGDEDGIMTTVSGSASAASSAAAAAPPGTMTQLIGTLHRGRAVYGIHGASDHLLCDIAESKKVPLLLNCIGGTVYSTLRSLVNPITMLYNDIMRKLLEHFDPKPLTIVERFHFHKREQSTSETLAEFMAELRRLAAKCEFGTHLDQALRDRFVCGMRNEGVQRRLLSESDLDLNKAIRIAFMMASAQTNTQALKTVQPVVAQVDRPQGGTVERPFPGASYACNHCGGTGHSPSECRFREAVCHRCYKRGHLRRVCQSARATRGRFQAKPRRQAHLVEAEPITCVLCPNRGHCQSLQGSDTIKWAARGFLHI